MRKTRLVLILRRLTHVLIVKSARRFSKQLSVTAAHIYCCLLEHCWSLCPTSQQQPESLVGAASPLPGPAQSHQGRSRALGTRWGISQYIIPAVPDAEQVGAYHHVTVLQLKWDDDVLVTCQHFVLQHFTDYTV